MQPCDIAKVDAVSSLLKVSQNERGAKWRACFFSAVVDASFACGSPQLFTGPDGFPYFALLSPEPYKSFELLLPVQSGRTSRRRRIWRGHQSQPGFC